MNLFILNSQILQLLQAEELKNFLNLPSEDCILICRKTPFDGHKTGIRSIEVVKKYGDWKSIHLIEQIQSNSYYAHLLNFVLFEKEVKKIINGGALETLVLGNYANEPMRSLANKFGSSGKIFVLDEGTSTIPLVKSRELGVSKKNVSSFLKKRVLNLEPGHIKYNLSFFTSFNIKSTEKTQVIKNDYRLVKQRVKLVNTKDTVLFIGSALIEAGIITLNLHLHYLKLAFDYFEKDVNYIAHPRESVENLKAIESLGRVTITRLDIPVELFLLEEKLLPAQVASFYSTALINCLRIFGSKLKYYSFRLPENILMCNRQKIIDVYKQLYELRSERLHLLEL